VVAVLDSNVLISAIVFGGKPRQVIRQALKGKYIPVVSPSILAEVEAVLNGPKFGFSPEQTEAVVSEIPSLARVVTPRRRVRAVPADPDDDRVLEYALEAGADFVVTGDSHLLELTEYHGVKILTSAAFLDLL
jgi:uncharacterized protein